MKKFLLHCEIAAWEQIYILHKLNRDLLCLISDNNHSFYFRQLDKSSVLEHGSQNQDNNMCQ
jgi:hypothetical protein